MRLEGKSPGSSLWQPTPPPPPPISHRFSMDFPAEIPPRAPAPPKPRDPTLPPSLPFPCSPGLRFSPKMEFLRRKAAQEPPSIPHPKGPEMFPLQSRGIHPKFSPFPLILAARDVSIRFQQRGFTNTRIKRGGNNAGTSRGFPKGFFSRFSPFLPLPDPLDPRLPAPSPAVTLPLSKHDVVPGKCLREEEAPPHPAARKKSGKTALEVGWIQVGGGRVRMLQRGAGLGNPGGFCTGGMKTKPKNSSPNSFFQCFLWEKKWFRFPGGILNLF